MQNLLLKKIEILSQKANDEEKINLDTYSLVLMKPDNLINGTENKIRDEEMEICKRIPRKSNQDFYNKLDKINKDIEKWKLI